jgi:glycosyltransferase involved in cell wall biosynthesis
LIVGDGPSRAALQAQHGRHVFAGMRTGEDLAAHYASADCFIFPSLSETFGNVITEALASGLPVTAFDYAAAAERITEGVNGHRIPMNDEAAFIAACVRWAGPPHALAQLQQAARASVMDLDWHTVSRRQAEILAATIDTHQARREVRGSLAAQRG